MAWAALESANRFFKTEEKSVTYIFTARLAVFEGFGDIGFRFLPYR